MRLEVGDMVVYASHGVGCVAAKGKRDVLDAEQDLVVVEFADGLKVTLPLERAEKYLRPLASDADVRRVQKTLREDRVVEAEPWLKRRKDAQAKLTGGGAIELAEIVRDGVIRGRKLAGKGLGTQGSDSERKILVKARDLLSGEIAAALGLEPKQAEAWIDEQLTEQPRPG
jgi:CarD family transcriptional regulator